MKLFDDNNDDNNEIGKIEINKEFAKRYEHNKKREDLQRLEEMKKKGLLESSGSESGSSESESESDDVEDDGVKFFDALLKVKKKDPILMEKDMKLFDDDDDNDDGGGDNEERVKKERPKYLKDVMAQHLIEEGPQFGGKDEGGVKRVKSYAQEQDELRKEVLEAIAKAEEGGEEDGDGELLREKERGEDANGVVDEEMSKKLDEYFGEDAKLDEKERFLKNFFAKKMWVDKEKGKKLEVDEDELAWLSEDEEALDRQDDLEREILFRHEENVGDRVMGYSRVVVGSVRKESNARKGQRERKKERMVQAEAERQEEVKRLKNLKKKEIQERLEKILEIAGIDKGGGGISLTEEDLEEDFDADEFDKKMREAFGDEYYQAEDVDPGFGSGDEGESDLEKPDFDKEDELLGLPKDWDVIKSNGGFLVEREKRLKNEDDEDDTEVEENDEMEVDENDEMEVEEGKRKRKRKISLKEKVALDMELDELYKLDYEDAIGDLKTRFKYREVAPRKYGLSAVEILAMDEKDLNQYVSLKKLAPYREKEWKVHPMQRQSFMKKKGLLLQGLAKGQMSRKKRRRVEGDDVGESLKMGARQEEDVKAQGKEVSNDESQLSRKAKRRRRQQEKKLPESRLVAYGKIASSSKSKSKN